MDRINTGTVVEQVDVRLERERRRRRSLFVCCSPSSRRWRRLTETTSSSSSARSPHRSALSSEIRSPVSARNRTTRRSCGVGRRGHGFAAITPSSVALSITDSGARMRRTVAHERPVGARFTVSSHRSYGSFLIRRCVDRADPNPADARRTYLSRSRRDSIAVAGRTPAKHAQPFLGVIRDGRAASGGTPPPGSASPWHGTASPRQAAGEDRSRSFRTPVTWRSYAMQSPSRGPPREWEMNSWPRSRRR